MFSRHKDRILQPGLAYPAAGFAAQTASAGYYERDSRGWAAPCHQDKKDREHFSAIAERA